MKHTDGKIKIVKTKDDKAILKTETGFEFPVPLNYLIGAGNEAKNYKEFIIKELQRRKVYFMPLD
ncbi:MAG: hypothetical protein PHY47_01385 [Lachnospiraceae bacterium]|nr:hypothetical protein [Lachnospiraceae bacterium]